MKYVTSIERLAKEKIVLNMLHENLPLEQISRLTGLTIEQIQQLQLEQQA